jgi:hypothetical protein
LLLLVGASRRSTRGACLAVSSVPCCIAVLPVDGQAVTNGSGRADDSSTVSAGHTGIHVRESIRLEVPVEEVYRYWRELPTSKALVPADRAARRRASGQQPLGRLSFGRARGGRDTDIRDQAVPIIQQDVAGSRRATMTGASAFRPDPDREA